MRPIILVSIAVALMLGVAGAAFLRGAGQAQLDPAYVQCPSASYASAS